MRIEQVVRPSPPPTSPTTPQTKTTAKKRRRGRPKGSKNQDQTAVSLNPELLHIKSMITALFDLIVGAVAPTHLALDGHFGNNYTLQMARQMGLHKVGDTLVVTRLDRLARSTLHLCQIAEILREKQVNLQVLDQNIETLDATGRLLFNMLGAIAQGEEKPLEFIGVAAQILREKLGIDLEQLEQQLRLAMS